jgi:hypothetical protein
MRLVFHLASDDRKKSRPASSITLPSLPAPEISFGKLYEADIDINKISDSAVGNPFSS